MQNGCMDFLEKSVSAYQAVSQVADRLKEHGYHQLYENAEWNLDMDGKYFVIRNDSSLIAFHMPPKSADGFHIVCAHTDSPCFKIKENPMIKVEDSYIKLNVEKYGGMILESWLDRPLSIAGRIVVRNQNEEKTDNKEPDLKTILVDFQEPLFIIPSLAIHMHRGKAEEKELNPQLHLLPLAGTNVETENFMASLARLAKVDEKDILGMDLYLYNIQKPVCLGMNQELIASPRLDDLECVYCGLEAFLKSDPKEKTNVLALFDNEEVGSMTMQGADSNFLLTVLKRIASEKKIGDFERILAGSFMLSADNAHALHPNYADKADLTNRPSINKGIVIKYHGGQKYTTSAYSGAYVKALCEQNKIPYQTYHNRSDIAGGSTLGNIALSSVSIPAADIGLAQLSMHSAFETAGMHDIAHMEKVMQVFFEI